MNNTQLSSRVDWMSCEIERSAVEAVPRGLDGVRPPRAEVSQSQLSLPKEVVPSVGGEGEVSGRKDGDDVVLGGSDIPFRRESAMVAGGGVLYVKGVGSKKVSKGLRCLIVNLQRRNWMVTGGEERQCRRESSNI